MQKSTKQIKIDSELHKMVKIYAEAHSMTLQDVIEDALLRLLDKYPETRNKISELLNKNG